MMKTLSDVVVTWFPIRENPGGQEALDLPVCQETVPHRRAWTAKRDLIAATNDAEIWREPTATEILCWQLDQIQPGHLPDTEATWLVATTGEIGLGVPTVMAVRLQETNRN